jgi:HPt (histidine-containing phosphotransfer) domain-containing protein
MSQDPMDARLAMLRRVGGDKLIHELIQLLLDSVPAKLVAARAALEQGDTDQVGRAGHSLTSSAGNLGAREMQHAAFALEQAAASGEGNLSELLHHLETCWERTRQLLAQKQRELKP